MRGITRPGVPKLAEALGCGRAPVRRCRSRTNIQQDARDACDEPLQVAAVGLTRHDHDISPQHVLTRNSFGAKTCFSLRLKDSCEQCLGRELAFAVSAWTLRHCLVWPRGGRIMSSEQRLSDILGEFARTMVTDFPIQSILDRLVESYRRHPADHFCRCDAHLTRRNAPLCSRLGRFRLVFRGVADRTG